MSTLPLFDDAPVPDDVPALRRLQVVAQSGEALSPAARAYNQQLARLDKLKSQLAELEALSLAHRQALAKHVYPLEQKQLALTKEMVLWLDEQLLRPPGQVKLTANQRKAACEIVCSLAADLAETGDDAMVAIHDRHSSQSLAELERADVQSMKATLEAMMGPDFIPDDPDATLEDVMRAAAARMQAESQARADERKEAAAKRKAKKAAKAKQPGAEEALQAGADINLRTLYRQLAAALHPDREPDERERQRKTALMSEANAAYDRKDIVTLLDIQQRLALADPQAVARMPDDKIKGLTLLVKAQVAELERERALTQQALCHEFDVPAYLSLTVRTLQMLLQARIHEVGAALSAMEADLAQVQQPAGFKRWLTQQNRLNKQMEREVPWDIPF